MQPSTRSGPLYYICAAPGTGKSTLLPALVAAADGEVVIDIDELLEDGALLGVPIAFPDAEPVWPAYDRMWGRITAMIRRAGHPVVLLTQVPDASDLQRSARDPGVYWLGWDCPDAVRAQRLVKRGWPQARIDDALIDAACCRRLLPDIVTSNGSEPADNVAQDLLARLRQMSRSRAGHA